MRNVESPFVRYTTVPKGCINGVSDVDERIGTLDWKEVIDCLRKW